MNELRRACKTKLETLQGRDYFVGSYLYEEMSLKLYLNDIESEDVYRIYVDQNKGIMVDCFFCPFFGWM
jgi:hypothetical protein